MTTTTNNTTPKGGADEIETSAMENCLLLLSTKAASAAAAAAVTVGDDVEKKYSCKTCGKKFNTFQALGGHRASRNKLKIVTTGGGGGERDVESVVKAKTHSCLVCGMEFPIGQALGGHMRRHRSLAAAAGSSDRSCVTTVTEFSIGNSGGSDDDAGFKKEKKRKHDDVVDGELERVVMKKLSNDEVCLDLGLGFTPWVAVNREEERRGDEDYEIEEGEIVEEEENDFLKLELRLPISGLLSYNN